MICYRVDFTRHYRRFSPLTFYYRCHGFLLRVGTKLGKVCLIRVSQVKGSVQARHLAVGLCPLKGKACRSQNEPYGSPTNKPSAASTPKSRPGAARSRNILARCQTASRGPHRKAKEWRESGEDKREFEELLRQALPMSRSTIRSRIRTRNEPLLRANAS